MDAEQIEKVALPGAVLWTACSGSGPPLLLASGGPGCCDYLEPVARILETHARVLRFDARGCGESSPEGPYDLATTLADLEGLRSHFGWERWWVGGHSWGADLALCYALAHPERVSGLLLLCPHGPHNDRSWSAAYHGARDRRGEEEPLYRREPNLEVNRVGNASFREAIQRAGFFRELADLQAPALVVAAERDIRPTWPLAQLAALLPRGRYVEIPGAEHFVWLRSADALAEALVRFLDELSRGSGAAPSR